ncbi:MAG: ABC transporter permease [Ruminococcaceae bacterium]|nr:ABC transporter permease [Oscillospiraceae bacterium]
MKQFVHACHMVWRNRKSYALLSVTVVLTFSFLLGYLLYTDSMMYNRYKFYLRTDRNVVIVSSPDWPNQYFELFYQKTEEAGSAERYTILSLISEQSISLPQMENGMQTDILQDCSFIPRHVWTVYDLNAAEIEPLTVQWLDGRDGETVNLGKREMLMERSLFEFLKLDQEEKPTYELRLKTREQTEIIDGKLVLSVPSQTVSYEMNVAGIIETVNGDIYRKHGTSIEGSHISGEMYLPMSLLDELPDEVRDSLEFRRHDVYYTDVPEVTTSFADTMGNIYGGGVAKSSYMLRDAAIKAINNANRNKAIIAAALFVILGISLYSCFTNALKDRKFEIGVKRAIGASGWSIIRQFLYEGLLVMGADILLSVALIADLAVIYKYVLSRMPEMVERYEAFIIYLSPWSAGMFALCAMGLTIGFSLIFAWQSTQVQIVDYLKAE